MGKGGAAASRNLLNVGKPSVDYRTLVPRIKAATGKVLNINSYRRTHPDAASSLNSKDVSSQHPDLVYPPDISSAEHEYALISIDHLFKVKPHRGEPPEAVAFPALELLTDPRPATYTAALAYLASTVNGAAGSVDVTCPAPDLNSSESEKFKPLEVDLTKNEWYARVLSANVALLCQTNNNFKLELLKSKEGTDEPPADRLTACPPSIWKGNFGEGVTDAYFASLGYRCVNGRPDPQQTGAVFLSGQGLDHLFVDTQPSDIRPRFVVAETKYLFDEKWGERKNRLPVDKADKREPGKKVFRQLSPEWVADRLTDLLSSPASALLLTDEEHEALLAASGHTKRRAHRSAPRSNLPRVLVVVTSKWAPPHNGVFYRHNPATLTKERIADHVVVLRLSSEAIEGTASTFISQRFEDLKNHVHGQIG